jgi:hypothetical protein
MTNFGRFRDFCTDFRAVVPFFHSLGSVHLHGNSTPRPKDLKGFYRCLVMGGNPRIFRRALPSGENVAGCRPLQRMSLERGRAGDGLKLAEAAENWPRVDGHRQFADIPEVAMTSTTAPGVTHRWTNLRSYADEVAAARSAAGFHYRFSSTVGRDMGRQIGAPTIKTNHAAARVNFTAVNSERRRPRRALGGTLQRLPVRQNLGR